MPIKFSCQHCKKRIAAPSRKAGLSGKCPNCARTISIPHSQPTRPKLTKQEQTQSEKYPVAFEQKKTELQPSLTSAQTSPEHSIIEWGIAFAVIAVALVVGICVISYYSNRLKLTKAEITANEQAKELAIAEEAKQTEAKRKQEAHQRLRQRYLISDGVDIDSPLSWTEQKRAQVDARNDFKIDLQATELSISYNEFTGGNRIEDLLDRLHSYRSDRNDEFRTKDEIRKLDIEHFAKFELGGKKIDDLFIFDIGSNFRYDPELRQFQAQLNASMEKLDFDFRGGSEYLAANDFGVTVNASKSVSEYKGITTDQEIEIALLSQPDEAKQIKDNLGVVVIVNLAARNNSSTNHLSSAYIKRVETGSKYPTLSDPNVHLKKYELVEVIVQHIWIYDKKTGEILKKKQLAR